MPGEILRPLGLTVERRQYPVSPRSEAAYAQINTEFDRLFQELYSKADQLAVSSMRRGQCSVTCWPLVPVVLGIAGLSIRASTQCANPCCIVQH